MGNENRPDFPQKSSKEKGEKWGSTGGHPKSGETSIEGMKSIIGMDFVME